MPNPNRRTFLAACAACAACPLPAFSTEERRAGPVHAGKPSDYPRDGAYDAYAKEHGFFIVRHKGRLFAPTAICTHKDTPLKLKGSAFACPKHGARFTLQGTVTKPPAKHPLPRCAIQLGDGGHITVDPSVTFEKDQWDDAESFVELK